MRVVTWNMNLAAPWRLRTHDQAWHYLLGLGPDIALVQEALPPPWVRWAGALIHGPTKTFGSFIFSPRYPMERLKPPAGGGLHAVGDYLALAEVSLPDGSDAFVASVHAIARTAIDSQRAGLDPILLKRPSVWQPMVNDAVFVGLEELVRDRRFVVGGDWNTARLFDEAYSGTPGTEFFVRAEGRGWIECVNPDLPGEPRTWFRSGDGPYQLDHIFCDAETADLKPDVWVAEEAATQLGLSDHAPLIVDFDVPSIAMARFQEDDHEDADGVPSLEPEDGG